MRAGVLDRNAALSPARLIAVIGLSLTLAYAVVLLSALYNGHWLLDAEGRPIASDFVNVWAAGRLTGDGHPALAYDWTVHKSMEVRAVGHAFDNYYGWHYPPTFLFVASALALIPIVPATLLWLAATLPAYLVAVRAIAGERAGYLLAFGFPATLWNITASQNGFLTAGLIGGTLALLERQPIAAGVCLGLLTYKPHFGLLFPVAFIAAQHWRVLIAAATTATLMIAVSWLTFGTSAWLAFFEATPKMTEAVLGQGLAEFDRLQSVFGLVRAQGGNAGAAWAAQIVAAVACAVLVFSLWRSRTAYELKAAGLVTAALIATPYLYIYDFVVLAIPAAYLVRIGLSTGFTIVERAGLPAAGLLLLSYPYVKTQVGLAAAVIVAGLIGWRFLTTKAGAAPET
jgi:arabinofuranan 3-O-arabinosyltransferase